MYMSYTSEEKTRIKAILKAFSTFIEEAEEFDICYSKKWGGIWICIEDEDIFVIESAKELLDALIFQMLSSVGDPYLMNGQRIDQPSREQEETEARLRLAAIFETAEGERDYCYEVMDRFFDDCKAGR